MILYAVPILAEVENKSQVEIYMREISKVTKNHPDLYKNDYYQYTEKIKDRAFEIIKEHPGIFIKKYFWGVMDTYMSVERIYVKKITNESGIVEVDYIDNFESNGMWDTILKILTQPGKTKFYTLIIIPFLLIIYLSSLSGIIILFKNNKIFEMVIIVIPILYFTLITGSAGLGRFKLPFVPFLLTLSAIFISSLFSKKSKVNQINLHE